MKRTIKLVAVVMVVAMLALALVSCAKTLSGTYEADVMGTKISYTFEKDTFVKKTTTNVFGADVTTTEEGTYEIKEDPNNADKLVIVLTTTKDDTTVSKEYSFSEGQLDGSKFIVIDGRNYTLVK
jgi:hypothetical protein